MFKKRNLIFFCLLILGVFLITGCWLIPAPTYTVTYDVNGSTGGSVPTDSTEYKENDTVTVLDKGDLVNTGYAFAGWNTQADGSGTDQAEGSTFTMGAADVTLYAQWTINTYTVTFDSQGGSAVDSQTVEHGGLATEPTDPTKTGHTFGGWYKESECTNPWDFDTDTVTSDVTLYAKWTINTYTVTFNSQGGSAVSSQTVKFGRKAVEPEDPTKTGYTFAGWYKESGCINPWNFDTDKVGSNMTLYAKWTIKTYTVTFDSQGGSAVGPQTVEYGGLATEPADPTRTGHTFGGWYKESECINSWNFDTDTVTSDVTLFAKWTINTYTVTFNKNGGDTEADPITKSATHGGNVGTLPTEPTRTGNTFTSWNTKTNGSGTEFTAATAVTANLTVYAQWASSDATLSDLSLSSGTLVPIFASATINYTAQVENNITSITVTPTAADTNATITVNGTPVASGSATGAISLDVGENTITTVVTAEDGTTTKIYTVIVTRAAVPITAIDVITGTAQVGVELTAGALTPSGATATYQWRICTTVDGTYIDIGGATLTTYTPVADDVTKFIKVSATGTGNYSGTVTSAATAAVANGEQAAPTGLAGVAPTTYGGTDGKITGTTIAMEYKLSTDTIWTPATATEIIDLAAGTYHVRYAAKTGFNAGIPVDVVVPALAIGHSHGGGIVAYILIDGDPGYVTGEQHGLIAATADQSTGIQWYNGAYTTTGATGTVLGTGSANTTTIIASQGATATDYAAGLARAHNGGGYDDWFLPSKDELDKLYINRVAISGFADYYYWSSSEYDAYIAWYQYFGSYYQLPYDKNLSLRVRAVRAF